MPPAFWYVLAAYLQHVADGGAHPHLAGALSEHRHQASDPAEQFTMVVGRVLTGLLPKAAL